MTGGGFELHPGAAEDITAIFEFIAEDSPEAARRVREEISRRSTLWLDFLNKATGDPTLPTGPCDFVWCPST